MGRSQRYGTSAASPDYRAGPPRRPSGAHRRAGRSWRGVVQEALEHQRSIFLKIPDSGRFFDIVDSAEAGVKGCRNSRGLSTPADMMVPKLDVVELRQIVLLEDRPKLR